MIIVYVLIPFLLTTIFIIWLIIASIGYFEKKTANLFSSWEILILIYYKLRNKNEIFQKYTFDILRKKILAKDLYDFYNINSREIFIVNFNNHLARFGLMVKGITDEEYNKLFIRILTANPSIFEEQSYKVYTIQILTYYIWWYLHICDENVNYKLPFKYYLYFLYFKCKFYLLYSRKMPLLYPYQDDDLSCQGIDKEYKKAQFFIKNINSITRSLNFLFSIPQH